jgi:hypothetical protein
MKHPPVPKKHAAALRELQVIPGIGPSLARDLVSLGIHRVADLKGRDPERLYRRLEKLAGTRMDPCVLYTFRCAVYYASNSRHKPRLLKWWNWMDADGARKRKRG